MQARMARNATRRKHPTMRPTKAPIGITIPVLSVALGASEVDAVVDVELVVGAVIRDEGFWVLGIVVIPVLGSEVLRRGVAVKDVSMTEVVRKGVTVKWGAGRAVTGQPTGVCLQAFTLQHPVKNWPSKLQLHQSEDGQSAFSGMVTSFLVR